jgi:molybdopterin molybdotransferase
MLSVAEATERITRSIFLVPKTDRVPLTEAVGRVLAAPVISRRRQPPNDVSAMDGYALRFVDAEFLPAKLKVVGSIPAGGRFERPIASGEAVRIFTGAPLPSGADTIVIQENTAREDDVVVIREGVVRGKHIRRAGLDFAGNAAVLEPPRRLSSFDIALAAAAGVANVTVRRRPRVAIMATGDELVRPGGPAGPSEIYASSIYGIAALVEQWGASPRDIGIARDHKSSLIRVAEGAKGADMFVTLGGASVGEHDLVQSALSEAGLEIDFWKIAMRPGKPLMFGRFGDMPMLGLPGNPVSALVCAVLFLKPAIDALLGLPPQPQVRLPVVIGCDLPANDGREDYLRASLTHADGKFVALPFALQDSSMLSALAMAECLLVRPPLSPPAYGGDIGEAIPLTPGLL